MGVDRRLVLTYAVTNLFFIASGAVTLAISIIWKNDALNNPTSGAVEQNIIFMMTPTLLGAVAGIITLIAGISSFPPLTMPTSRGWLHIHSWLCVIASVTLLVLGLKIWTLTLDEKNNIFDAYTRATPDTIAALQDRLNCCGFFNSTMPTFVASVSCPNAPTAATQNGCVIPLQPYADLFLDRLFTTLFGFVGIGTCAILASAMLLKARSTEARYIRIAEKGVY